MKCSTEQAELVKYYDELREADEAMRRFMGMDIEPPPDPLHFVRPWMTYEEVITRWYNGE